MPTPKASAPAGDKAAGNYWMKPTKEDIQDMNRVQRQKVVNLTVGREHVGYIRFRVPVDLTAVDLDELIGGIVILETRSATVYPNVAKKPPVGKGLNVPAEISLEQSWPRGRDKKTPVHDKSGHRLNKHIERLRRIENTTFVNYDENSGVWTFTVEHFTTYGFDDDDEDETDNETGVDKMDSDETPTQPRQTSREVGSPEIDPDDTFEFRRKRMSLPGAFDYTEASDEEDVADTTNQGQSFLSDRSAGSASYEVMPYRAEDEVMDEEYASASPEPAGSSPRQHHAAEREDVPPYIEPAGELQETPGGIMRARMRAIKDAASPLKVQIADGDDWMNMLQKSVSPHKRTDRAALRALNDEEMYRQTNEAGRQNGAGPMRKSTLSEVRGFATSIDLMNSLFEKGKAAPQHIHGSSYPPGLIKVGF